MIGELGQDCACTHEQRHARTRAGITLRLVVGIVAAACCVAAAGLWSESASAGLTRNYLSSFGSFNSVQGLAIEQASQDVYVYDGGGEAIYKFDAAGNPVNFSSTGTNEISGVPSAFSDEGEIAVDGSAGPAKGDIYVAHASYSNVLVYNAAGEQVGEITEEAGKPWGEACGVAVGSDGAVYVGLYSNIVNKYVPSSGVVTDGDYAGSYEGVQGVCNVGVDPAGNLFVDTWGSGPLTSFAPSQLGVASAEGSIVDESGSTVAIDPATEHVFVDEQSQISEFGPNGKPEKEPLGVFGVSGSGALSNSLGIAADAGDNEVYAASGSGAVNVYGTPVIVPGAKTTAASNVEAESATATGEVDPEGLAIEECYFEYGESTSYGQSTPCAETDGDIGTGIGYVTVQADLTGLTIGTKYHYRLVVANANGLAFGEDVNFVYLVQKIESEYVDNVSANSATLGGSLNPNGISTDYFFEYGPSSNYGMRTLTYEASGEAVQAVTGELTNLNASTNYHYRLVSISMRGAVDGADQMFTTEGPGGSLVLLDDRQWELVSPVEKHGAGIIPQRDGGDVIQAAENGDGLIYLSQNPIDNEPEGNRAPEPTEILARRIPGAGWVNRTMTTPNNEIHGLPIGEGTEYKAFSPDLSEAILEPSSTEALTSGVTQRTSYLRNESGCTEEKQSCYLPLLTTADTAAGAVWDTEPESVSTKARFVVASKNMTHALIESKTALTEGAPETPGFGSEGALYEWSDGRLNIVSINEAGEPVEGEAGGAYGKINVRGAISGNGTRVFFCAFTSFGCEYGGALYMRDTETQESVRLDPAVSTRREYQIASEDGSRAFFTYSEGFGTERLAACEFIEVAGKTACRLTEVAPDPVGSVIGIDAEGRTVYFVSTAALTGEAVAGEDNLYVARLKDNAWEASVIATLSSEDSLDWASYGSNYAEIDHMTAMVSANGRYLAFMSDRSLTGYDNRDAVSGEPDQEVFLYDERAGKLRCASCEPSGARPEGMRYEGGLNPPLVNRQEIWRETWIAASLPGWDNIGLSYAIHQTTYLTNEGRLFFNSSDTLAAQDSNGLVDVYEYEPGGVGSCARSDGCVQLISSGTSGEESVFLDGSGSGNDVFFITAAQLVGRDQDTAYDVYDAHVCTSEVPCERQPVAPPPCSSGESCKPAQTPQPGIYGAPASATFSGVGDLLAGSHQARPRTGGDPRKLRLALKRCKRKYARNTRKARRCDRRARHQYESAVRRSWGRVKVHGHAALAQRLHSDGSIHNRRGR